jgi:hypothetical protein
MRVEPSERSGAPYPTECPQCGKHGGTPQMITTVSEDRRLIRVDLLCGYCGHGWTYDKTDDKPA